MVKMAHCDQSMGGELSPLSGHLGEPAPGRSSASRGWTRCWLRVDTHSDEKDPTDGNNRYAIRGQNVQLSNPGRLETWQVGQGRWDGSRSTAIGRRPQCARPCNSVVGLPGRGAFARSWCKERQLSRRWGGNMMVASPCAVATRSQCNAAHKQRGQRV